MTKRILNQFGSLRHSLVKEAEQAHEQSDTKNSNKLVDIAGKINDAQIDYANLPKRFR